MLSDAEELKLNESYDFDVTIDHEGQSYAGKLHLSPSHISLTIMGESSQYRRFEAWRDEKDYIVCRGFNNRFVVCNLKIKKSQHRTLSRHPENWGYYEYHYRAEYVISCPSYRVGKYTSIEIFSNTLDSWIGHTTTQDKIIEYHERKELVNENEDRLVEVETEVQGVGILVVSYNFSWHYLPNEFSSGIVFPPSITLYLNHELDSVEVKNEYDRLYQFLSYIMGDELEIDRIILTQESASWHDQCSLYFPSHEHNKRYEHALIFHPLSHNLRDLSLGIPSLDLNIFSAYYSLEPKEIAYWEKYLRYKRMANIEERFLGYFRILESLCYKKKTFVDADLLGELSARIKPYLVKRFGTAKNVKGLLGAVKRANESKYNTAKCIGDFFASLPHELVEGWIFGKSDIESICKLRNDITHANDVDVTQDDLQSYTVFIEVLLVIALYQKVGFNLANESRLVRRISGYHLIHPHKVEYVKMPQIE